MAEALEKNPGELDALIEEGQRRRRILADPMSLEAQQAIEEAIRQQNILHNMEAALEEHPESFGRIDMLYVRCLVDGHPIDAFVDTGAQMTVMSYECAERCGIVRLLDRRFEGVAVGVGTGKICGRIHSVPVKLGSQFIPCSFTVLESNAGPAVIVGLDCLRRLQATLDMRRDALLVNGEEIPFLKGADIPKDVFGHDKRGE